MTPRIEQRECHDPSKYNRPFSGKSSNVVSQYDSTGFDQYIRGCRSILRGSEALDRQVGFARNSVIWEFEFYDIR